MKQNNDPASQPAVVLKQENHCFTTTRGDPPPEARGGMRCVDTTVRTYHGTVVHKYRGAGNIHDRQVLLWNPEQGLGFMLTKEEIKMFWNYTKKS